MPVTATFATCTVLALLTTCQGDSFLAAQPRVSTAHVRQSLWAELGARSNPVRLAELEKELRPMYAALPKGEHGNLEHAVVRYAAHRYFLHRHGWHMRGLEPSTVSGNMSSQSSIKADMVPSYIQDVFEEYLGKRGFSLHDLAVYMATLEDLVNEERLGELLKAFRVHGVSHGDSMAVNVLDELLTTYMSSYILGKDLSNASLHTLREQNIEEFYPGWADTVSWLADVRRSVEFKDVSRLNPFVSRRVNLAGTQRVVDEIGDRYGAFQDLECRGLKEALLSMEHLETGRVRLKDFYSTGLGGEWQFTESVAYLRELGALDESDPKRPSVVIPNYIAGPSNCLVSTGFYTVCCRDECEGLLHHLEATLATPLANVSAIAAVASSLPSDTVEAPRNLSEDLMRRLGEIADHHDGLVPIHGRLFSQFMHHAYPRECPFPHLSGTTAPMTQEAWVSTFGFDSMIISEREKFKIDANFDDGSVWSGSEALPWTATEELVAQHRHGRVLTRPSSMKSYVRAFLLAVLGVSVALHLGQRLWSAPSEFSSSGSSLKGKEHFV